MNANRFDVIVRSAVAPRRAVVALFGALLAALLAPLATPAPHAAASGSGAAVIEIEIETETATRGPVVPRPVAGFAEGAAERSSKTDAAARSGAAAARG